jgi:hypothetical protein
MSSAWHIEEDPAGASDAEFVPTRGTVSLAFIRDTVRRLWYVWVGSAVLGLALAACWLVLVPPHSVGTVTLLLAHDPGTQPDAAMATDVSLLNTRTVAQQLDDKLDLNVSPDDVLKEIRAQPATSSVLKIEISGTDAADAVRRARVLGDTYLEYRKEQLTRQSEAVTQGYRDRVDALQLQVDQLTSQYDRITSREGSDEKSAEVLAQRGQLIGEITSLQSQIESETLEADAVVAASRVLDEASLVPQSPLRRAGLGLVSGLIGGLGIGLGLVGAYAITTARLRSRADVALAMGIPVAFSAGPVAPRVGRPRSRHKAALDLLVDGLDTAVPRSVEHRRLGLLTVDCEREGAMVLAALARRLGAGDSVLAVDLAGSGLLAQELDAANAGAEGPTGSVSVVSGSMVDAVTDVVLSLVPFEIGRGLGHVKSTTARCVVLVKSGTSTAERLNTVARAARSAGLDVLFLMLVGADSSDSSFGGESTSGPAQLK